MAMVFEIGKIASFHKAFSPREKLFSLTFSYDMRHLGETLWNRQTFWL
jgi:hypothetical protein